MYIICAIWNKIFDGLKEIARDVTRQRCVRNIGNYAYSPCRRHWQRTTQRATCSFYRGRRASGGTYVRVGRDYYSSQSCAPAARSLRPHRDGHGDSWSSTGCARVGHLPLASSFFPVRVCFVLFLSPASVRISRVPPPTTNCSANHICNTSYRAFAPAIVSQYGNADRSSIILAVPHVLTTYMYTTTAIAHLLPTSQSQCYRTSLIIYCYHFSRSHTVDLWVRARLPSSCTLSRDRISVSLAPWIRRPAAATTVVT